MAASFPTSTKSFTTKATGGTVQASHINDLQEEVVAIETALLTGPHPPIVFPATQDASTDVNTLDDYEEGTWTPTWTGSTTNPSIGNGTISASYIKIGKMVMWSLDLTYGSTSTAGSGTWRFTLPFTAASSSATSIGSGHITDLGTQHYVVSAYLFSTTVMQIVHDGNTGSGIGSGVPFTWATNDAVHVHGVYIADQ